jgi:DNA phosphorothioation-dependent restriction protein DptG
MNKCKGLQEIQNYLKDKKVNKVILYKNPVNHHPFSYEYVNPDHVSYVYGKKGKSVIKITKVYLSTLTVYFSDSINRFVYLVDYIINNLGVFTALYYVVLACVFLAFICNIPLIEGYVLARAIK